MNTADTAILNASGALDFRPRESWTYLVLQNPEGKLLWRHAPPGGTWPAEGPLGALAFGDERDFAAWFGRQHRDLQKRLDEGGWRLRRLNITLETEAAPSPIPADGGAEGVAGA